MRDKTLFAEDIIEAIDAIFSHIEGYELEDFKSDRKTYQAVIKEFEIIGEATKHIIEDAKKIAPEYPWRYVIDFRNVLVHEYFGIRFKTMWDIIFYELPTLKKHIEKLRRYYEKKNG
jgi:uncharacterized protein with HEPN domain